MIDELEKVYIECNPFTDKDDNGRTYTKTVYYISRFRLKIRNCV